MMTVLVEIIVQDGDKEFALPVGSEAFATDLLALLQKYGFDAKLLETRGDEVI